MRNIFTTLFSFILLVSFTSISYAQERTLKGHVTTLENIVVVNAEVKVLSSKETVLTDSLGNFEVSCLLKDKIKISANGFYSQKVKTEEIPNEAFINLVFKPGEKNLNVAMGYGHINEKDKSYATTTIKNDNNYKFAKYSNMIELITNSSPSIIVSGGSILIRGESSLNGSSAALIIINGVDARMSQLMELEPMNVKSVDVLKGAAAAIYGSRGANGAVVITTKRGGNNE